MTVAKKTSAIQWTDEMVAALRSMRATGTALYLCAERIGVTYATCVYKARDLGVANRMNSGRLTGEKHVIAQEEQRLADNPWELYESVPGWEAATAALNAALTDAVRGYHLARAEGVRSDVARTAASAKVWQVMLGHRDYGATDSEGIRYLDRKLDEGCE
jgi:hypothetical protein